ncbi:MAG: GIY-YIG nuclease family protein [Flavobacteriales bacterium]|nr:GIY-YIG nuclease family protein [Flavobacteriales bacterium]
MIAAQNIQLYLPGGDEAGVRRAHFTRNSKVVVYQVPREKLPHALKREELKRPGLYFLVAPTDLRSGQVYIGESDNCAERLSYHRTNKKQPLDWSYALIAVSPAIDKADVRWLEWHFHREVATAQRYAVVNPNSTKEPHATEEDKADRLHDVEAIRTLCDILGFPFTLAPRPTDVKEQYTCKGKQALGTGCPTADGFVVFMGSVAMAVLQRSTDATVVRRHAELVASKVLVPAGPDTLRFTKDYEFTSPSTAAAVVLGRSANGWTEWKDAEGRTLDEVRRKG